MTHYHDHTLVLLSVALAVLGSYTALHLWTRLRASKDYERLAWLCAASVSLGAGIWSMHFVAMLAISVPGAQIEYDPQTTFISLILPIAVTAFGFAMVARRADPLRLAFSGVVMGLGIVAMHYTGMAAIRFNGNLQYNQLWVAISVIVAIGASTAALWLALQNSTPSQRALAALVMGLAISGMHYSAMAGTAFNLAPSPLVEVSSGLRQTTLALWVTAATILILLLGLSAATVSRRLAEQTHRQRAALHDSEERFRLLVQGVTDYAIFMLDSEGKISNWNSGAERIKGYSASEVTGTPFSRFYTEEDRQAGLPQRALATAKETGRFEAEGWRVRKDGSKFLAHVVIDAIKDEEGELVGFAKITRDITESKQAQQDLEKTRELLAQSQKMEALGQLTGGVAHDFNNLLMIILGNLDTANSLLQSEQVNKDRLMRAVRNAHHGAQRATTLTKSLLAFSKRQPLQPQVIDVNETLKDAAPLLKRALGENRPLEIVGAAGAWNTEADPVQLEAALLNLILNARDAMPEGGKLPLNPRTLMSTSAMLPSMPTSNRASTL